MFDFVQRQLEQLFFPILFQNLVPFQGRLIWNAMQRVSPGLSIRAVTVLGLVLALAKLVGNTPFQPAQQPWGEASLLRVIFLDVLGDADYGFLDGVLGL